MFVYKMTIIMPSYNNGKYIKQSIESILAQEVDFSYQIIITDDASQDDSVKIIKDYENKYPHKVLALYAEKNSGLFQNYLKAVAKMNSEYFCVLDPDDYWTDCKRLQKAVDFLDNNKEYTIYATNLHRLYNDGTIELRYDWPNIDTCTSTYEDYINGRAIFSCTPSSTYRNIYFSNGIPEEFLALKGTEFEDSFRADTARNLIHLKRGKVYFVNESIGVCRYHGEGLCSKLLEFEKYITSAFAHIGYYQFFGYENLDKYIKIIKNLYICSVKEYYSALINEDFPYLNENIKNKYSYVFDWLSKHKNKSEDKRIPFSLELFSNLKNRQLIIWGTGSAAQKVINKYNIEINQDVFFVDNDIKKQGNKYLETEIKSPEIIKNYKKAIVLIASGYYKEIIKQIRERELCDEDRIINLYDYENNWV